VSKLYTK